MQLGEVANNIIGHYIQIDKSIYFHSGNWLGNLSNIEEDRNSNRLAGKNFLEIDEPTRLYVIINLFDTFESGTTYAKMFSWYREQLNEGRRMTNQDAYVEAIADIYQVNIIPYMEAWGLKISASTKEKVFEANYPLVSILKDMVNEGSLNEILPGEGIDKKYSIIENEVLQKYDITGDITLNIDIDDLSEIQGKVALLKQGNKIIKTIKIEDKQIEIQDVPVGTYYVQMPVLTGYSYEHTYIPVKESADNILNYEYQKTGDTDFNNYIMIRLLGYNYDTIAYQITFKDDYTKAEIKYPNQSGMRGNEYVKIYDAEGELVTEDVATGGYFEYSKGTHEIELEPGYTLEINYPNKYASKVVAYSTLNGTILPEYGALNTTTTYTVIEGGLLREDMTEEAAEDIAYEEIKDYLVNIIEGYKAKVTETELNNKIINFEEKADVISAYHQLRAEDQEPYAELIKRIKRGGVPTINVIENNLEYEVGTQIDLYSLISAVDNEDGTIKIDKNSTAIRTSLKETEAGTYDVTYEVKDSDNNVATKTIQIKITELEEVLPVTPPEEGGDEEEEVPPTIEPDEDEKEEEDEEEQKPPTIEEDSDNNETNKPNKPNNNGSSGVITNPQNNNENETNKSDNTNDDNANTSDENKNNGNNADKLNTNENINPSAEEEIENAIEDEENAEDNVQIQIDEQEHAENEPSLIYEKLPKTGDSSRVILIMIFVLATISIITFILLRKRIRK